VSVSVRLVDGGLREFDTGPELLVKLVYLQAQGLEGKQLVHQLLNDDWGAPPVYIDITGADDTGHPVEVRIPYR
jgi:hypothetical protein